MTFWAWAAGARDQEINRFLSIGIRESSLLSNFRRHHLLPFTHYHHHLHRIHQIKKKKMKIRRNDQQSSVGYLQSSSTSLSGFINFHYRHRGQQSVIIRFRFDKLWYKFQGADPLSPFSMFPHVPPVTCQHLSLFTSLIFNSQSI